MIFVTLGTQPIQFVRFMKEVDLLIETFDITESVIVQTGYTVYETNKAKIVDFFKSEEFDELINEARVVITHAGYGSLFKSIKTGKKIIAVARLKKYDEMVDDHQLELVKKLSSEGYIIDGTNSLIDAWNKIEEFTPRVYDFEGNIATNLSNYLDTMK